MAGINYDPERLSQKLKNNWPEVYARALNVTTTLGGFAASIAQAACTCELQRSASMWCVYMCGYACVQPGSVAEKGRKRHG
eukprot:scaffold100877_cov23-Tisochrysis_lutea.AAC.1